jgi:ABC-type branched-subunit amino acid transport system ATPase component
MGVVTGEMLVDGRQRDVSFQRKTGYVQQQDLHLQTSTVREALRFSAILRQPKTVPHAEKLAYVEEVLKLLEMDGYADAVVGVPGEGLNVEQRKRLTIGVELVAKPELLLFLDEPSSGLVRTLVMGPFSQANIVLGLSNLLEYHPAPPEAHRARAGDPLHDPPTVCHVVRTVRSSSVPR